MRIAIDYDETIADSMQYLLNQLNRAKGTDFIKSDVNQWEYHKALDINKHQFWTFYHAVMNRATEYDIWPQPTAMEVIPRLAKDHELYILTARQHHFRPQIADWVEHYFEGMFNDVYTCGGQEEGINKIEFMNSQSLDMLVDDSTRDYDECMEHDKDAILYTAPHNLPRCNRLRARDWHDVETILRLY